MKLFERKKKKTKKNNKKYITKEYVMCWFDLKSKIKMLDKKRKKKKCFVLFNLSYYPC